MQKLTNRKAALLSGDLFYEGQVCKTCGTSRRYTSCKKCVQCRADKNKKYYWDNRDKAIQSVKHWRKQNPENYKNQNRTNYIKNAASIKQKAKKWVEANYERVRETRKEYYRANSQKLKEVRKLWKENNREKVRFLQSKRRAAKRNAIPNWVNKAELELVYINCPEGKHVDHIVPLIGKRGKENVVCGLHVPWNLQYLEPAENISKGARYWPDM